MLDWYWGFDNLNNKCSIGLSLFNSLSDISMGYYPEVLFIEAWQRTNASITKSFVQEV